MASTATNTLIAPAVQVVSPSAAQQIKQTSTNFVAWGQEADRFTADVANRTAQALKESAENPDGTLRVVGEALRESVTKDGVVTNFVQDYVPGGGFVTAIAHAAAGNDDYAKYAAVKGASTTIATAGVVAGAAAGTVIGGPAGAVLGGSMGAAGAMVFEGAMKNVMEPSVRDKLPDLTVENVVVAGVIGGIAGGVGYGVGKAASSVGTRATAAAGRFSRTPAVRPRSNTVVQTLTRGRSNAVVGGRPAITGAVRNLSGLTRNQQLAMLAVGYATAGGREYGKRAGIGIGTGILKEVAKEYRIPELAEDTTSGLFQGGRRWAEGAAATAGTAVDDTLPGVPRTAMDAPIVTSRSRPRITGPRIAAGAGVALLLLAGGFGLTRLRGEQTENTSATNSPAAPAAPSTTASGGATDPESTTVTTGTTIATASTTATTAPATSSTALPTTASTRPTTIASTTTAPSTPTSTTSTSTSTSSTTSTTAPPPNRAPTVSNPGPQSSGSGQSISLPIVASDPDGDNLTYRATGLPAGVSINPDTGLITGSINSSASPENSVTVTVADDGSPSLSAEVTFPWDVNFG